MDEEIKNKFLCGLPLTVEESLYLADKYIESLEQQPCEDTISRADAINLVHDLAQPCDDSLDWDISADEMIDGIKSLPSVTLQPKTGHWIDTGSGQKCSECGEMQYGYDNFRCFCANCGAKMEVEP